jgi:hypothetical protein
MQGNPCDVDGLYPLEMKEIASLYDETRLLSRHWSRLTGTRSGRVGHCH